MNEPTDLAEYVEHADSGEDAVRMVKQFLAASTTCRNIPCRCGSRATAAMMFRCYACGEWFCKNCAPEHFNIDLAQWRERDLEPNPNKQTNNK